MQVYRIFNKVNKKSYVGVTQWEFQDRYPQSKWWKWTHNNHLKIAVEKYGLSQFDYEILWNGKGDKNSLSDLEKMYIQQYNSFIPFGYNLTTGGYKYKPVHQKEYELIDFHGNKYKISNLSKFCKLNKMNYGAMLNMVSGVSKSSQGFSLSTTDVGDVANPREEWVLENINSGELTILERGKIGKWASKQKLNSTGIEQVIYKQIKVSQGWKLKETILGKNYRNGLKHKNVLFINPQGEKQVIENIYKFCLDNKLDRKMFYNLIHGKSLEAYGWRLPCDIKEFNNKKSLRLGKKITLVSPNGQELEIRNISLFCRNNKFNRNSIEAMISGRTKQYKGWKIKI